MAKLTHVVTKRHKLKSDGVIVDDGQLMPALYSLLAAVIVGELRGNAAGVATLTVSQYFHDAVLLVANRYNVTVLALTRHDFPNLTIRVVPKQKEDWAVSRG